MKYIKAFIKQYCEKTGKVLYRSKTHAWLQALYFREKFGEGNAVYKCRWCGFYHLTTHASAEPPKKVLEKIKKII